MEYCLYYNQALLVQVRQWFAFFGGVVTFLLHPIFKHSVAYWLRFVGHPQIYDIDVLIHMYHMTTIRKSFAVESPGSLPAAVSAWGCSTAVERNVPRAEIEGQLYKMLPVENFDSSEMRMNFGTNVESKPRKGLSILYFTFSLEKSQKGKRSPCHGLLQS